MLCQMYEEANKTSFTNGWFRTGDQGYFDKEGYLKISGRLKEIINKGGEKISPLEVDNVLMDHPFIDQAVCFGYDDKMLGEKIKLCNLWEDQSWLSSCCQCPKMKILVKYITTRTF